MMETFVTRLRDDLRNARKSRDLVLMQTLQSLLARIDNAEAIPNTDADQEAGGEFFAGAKSGLGSTEAERKILTMEDIQTIIREEISELEQTIKAMGNIADRSHIESLEKKIEILKSIDSGII